MFVSEIYDIIDSLWNWEASSNSNPFNTGSISNGYFVVSSNNDNISMNTPIALPSHFQIKYTGLKTQETSSWNFMKIGENSSKSYDEGNLNSYMLYLRDNFNSKLPISSKSSSITNNTDFEIIYEYNNGVHTITQGNNIYSTTDTDISVDYFLGIGLANRGKIKKIQIKPL